MESLEGIADRTHVGLVRSEHWREKRSYNCICAGQGFPNNRGTVEECELL